MERDDRTNVPPCVVRCSNKRIADEAYSHVTNREIQQEYVVRLSTKCFLTREYGDHQAVTNERQYSCNKISK